MSTGEGHRSAAKVEINPGPGLEVDLGHSLEVNLRHGLGVKLGLVLEAGQEPKVKAITALTPRMIYICRRK